mmetsp:Transcript_598/g.1957  ORF Transcript_598/g.1957 Transcript_598/m.1957 type:complete len:221 (+) Transcript_598:788-1450(+)
MPTALAPRAIALYTSAPRFIPPSRNTSNLAGSYFFSRSAAITSTSTSREGLAVSRLRPPWLLTTIPSRPCWYARTASAPDCTPLSTSLMVVMERNHGTSSQVRSSAHLRFVMTDLGAVPPGVALRSVSRLPRPALSTVRNRASKPSACASRTVASLAPRSFSTYSCSQCVCPGRRAAAISDRGFEPMCGAICTIPFDAAARDSATSASGCASPPLALPLM